MKCVNILCIKRSINGESGCYDMSINQVKYCTNYHFYNELNNMLVEFGTRPLHDLMREASNKLLEKHNQ